MQYFAQTYNYDFAPLSQSMAGSNGASSVPIVAYVIAGALFFLLYIVPQTIVLWKLMQKAGHPGWPALVVIYREWISCKIAKAPTWLAVSLIVTTYVLPLLPTIGDFFVILAFILYIYWVVLFARQYDRSKSFWVLYVLAPLFVVFKVGKATYVGGETARSARRLTPTSG